MNARTAAAADSALAGMSGGIGAAVAAMRGDAVNLLAELEVSRLIEASVLIDQDFPAKYRISLGCTSGQPACGCSMCIQSDQQCLLCHCRRSCAAVQCCLLEKVSCRT